MAGGLRSIGIKKIVPAQIDFTKIVSGSSAGAGSYIALSSDGTPVLVLGASTSGDITSVTAGTGISGGGASGAVTVNLDISEYSDVQIASGDKFLILDSDGSTEQLESVDDVATFMAGAGISASSGVLAVGQSTGITVNADNIATNDSQIVHDNLSGFVANEHIDHSGVTITAGAGLSGGGTIESTRTLTLDISEFSDVQIASGDKFLILDSDGATEQLESVDDLATFMAGTGLDASSGELSVDVSDFMANGANDRVVTATGTDGMNAESNLTMGTYMSCLTRAGIGSGIGDPIATLQVYNDLDADAQDNLRNFENYQVVVKGGSTSGDIAGILLTTTSDGYGGSAIIHHDNGNFGPGNLIMYTKEASSASPPLETMIISGSGEIMKLRQPCFSVYKSSNQDLTGSAVNRVDFDTELFDVNSDYDTTAANFTAPVDGKYLFQGVLEFNALPAGISYALLTLNSSNNDYRFGVVDPQSHADQTDMTFPISCIMDLDANDTVFIDVYVHGSGQTLVLDGGAQSAGSYWQGYLLG